MRLPYYEKVNIGAVGGAASLGAKLNVVGAVKPKKELGGTRKVKLSPATAEKPERVTRVPVVSVYWNPT